MQELKGCVQARCKVRGCDLFFETFSWTVAEDVMASHRMMTGHYSYEIIDNYGK